jgi:hypothetical protein
MKAFEFETFSEYGFKYGTYLQKTPVYTEKIIQEGATGCKQAQIALPCLDIFIAL